MKTLADILNGMMRKSGGVKARPTPEFPQPLTAKNVRDIFSGCDDVVERDIYIGGKKELTGKLFFIDGLVSGTAISEDVLRPITDDDRLRALQDVRPAIDIIVHGGVYNHTVKLRDKLDDVVSDLLNGFCAIVFDREKKAVTFETKSDEKRSIGPPEEEKVVKGSKDAFIEVMRSNTTIIRRKLRNPNLKIKGLKIGRQTQTNVSIVYIDGLTEQRLVDETEKRLNKIDTEGMLTTGNIEEFLVDTPATPFPQLIYTERADKFCLNILEGRVGVLVDGLPIGYLTPGTFGQFFKVPEDYANHFIVSSALTLLRYFSLVITLFLPAFYVAVVMYHQEMIPTKLMLSIIESKQSVPFPTYIEVLGMLVSFELLQEAGLRLPNPVGETVSIIGALIVGQSAVEAKIVSPVVVIVVAIAGITGYTVPNQDMSMALRVCRFLMVIVAMAGGMFGLMLGSALLIYHLCTLETMGVTYMTPFAGAEGKFVGRTLMRQPMSGDGARDPALDGKGGGK